MGAGEWIDKDWRDVDWWSRSFTTSIWVRIEVFAPCALGKRINSVLPCGAWSEAVWICVFTALTGPPH